MNRKTLKDVAVFGGLVALAFASRLVMIEPNFHAVTAASLFAGFYFRGRAVAACVPLVAMTASDWIIGGYAREVMLAVYAALLLPIAWRSFLRHQLSSVRVAYCAVGSSLFFFLVTNAAVWHSSNWYSRGWDGLLQSYSAGLPFLANAMAGDLIFSAALFAAYALAVRFAGTPSRAVCLAPVAAHAA